MGPETMTRSRTLLLAAASTCLAAAGIHAQNVPAPDAPPRPDSKIELAEDGARAGSSADRGAATAFTPENVTRLRPVWRFDTEPGGLQATPLIDGETFYAPTPEQSVVALDAATGALKWRYVPEDASFQPVRGVSMWRRGETAILFAGHGNQLTALDPRTGRPIEHFGIKGSVDLRNGLGRDPSGFTANLTSPGTIYGDTIIVGFRTGESHPAGPGAIRAFDVHSGTLRWTFFLAPRAGEPGSETWPAAALTQAGGVNNWAGMALDVERGILFVPTGSAVDDFYGADRKGSNLFANSLVALDARTGRRLWHFQMVHHDIWDRDLASPPVLLTVRHDGRPVDAVAQASKQGLIYLFDRVTGKPLFPIEEREVPASDVPGEEAWPTQPFPLLPAPIARQHLTANMLTKRTPEAARAVRKAFAAMNNKGPYTPLTIGRQTVVFPGFNGGAEWGGAAVDHARGVMFINAMDVPWSGALERLVPGHENEHGRALYMQNCAACHGADRKGAPPEYPSLEGVLGRRNEIYLVNTVLRGRGRMPGFPQITGPELGALFGYLGVSRPIGGREDSGVAGPVQAGQTYVFTGFRKFLDPEGYPAVAPPWGTLNAIDMNTGQTLWKVPLGYYPELAAKGEKDTGTENYGGPVVTRSGVLFIGATIYDRKLRAFDARTGHLLAAFDLPYAGTATPVIYSVRGRSYIAIATSGDRDPKGPQGAAYVSFALPE